VGARAVEGRAGLAALTDEEWRQLVLSGRCEYCLSDPWDHCVTDEGKLARAPHALRRYAALRKVKKEAR
jgi:hypothetical protein